MNNLMDKVEEVVSGNTDVLNRGLLIVDDNQFLKKQVEAYINARGKTYRWFTGDISSPAFKEMLSGSHILVFDGLNYNKRAITGLLYGSMADPNSEFDGQYILFGTDIIKNAKLRSCFSMWTGNNFPK